MKIFTITELATQQIDGATQWTRAFYNLYDAMDAIEEYRQDIELLRGRDPKIDQLQWKVTVPGERWFCHDPARTETSWAITRCPVE